MPSDRDELFRLMVGLFAAGTGVAAVAIALVLAGGALGVIFLVNWLFF